MNQILRPSLRPTARAVLSLFAACTVVALPASSLKAEQRDHSFVLAQAGSAGGTIGKQGKSVSGGEDKPASQPQRKERKASAPVLRTTSERPSGASINGRWRVSQKCSHGTFEIELDIRQSSATQFSGTSRGITTGAVSQIVDGKLDGNKVTFGRRGAGLSDRWSARIEGSGRMTGTSSGPAWRCTYTAARQ